MSGPQEEKIKLAKRLGRIRGQVDAIQCARGRGACRGRVAAGDRLRGALDGFLAEVFEDHIRERMVQAKDRASGRKAAEELIGIVHSYPT